MYSPATEVDELLHEVRLSQSDGAEVTVDFADFCRVILHKATRIEGERRPDGSKWACLGTTRPTGIELRGKAGFAKALTRECELTEEEWQNATHQEDFVEHGGTFYKRSIDFSRQEWNSFDMPPLRQTHFVRVGDAFYSPSSESRPDGLTWQEALVPPSESTPSGTELRGKLELSKLLDNKKLVFTKEEWKELGVKDLRHSHYVKGRAAFFQPIPVRHATKTQLIEDVIKCFKSFHIAFQAVDDGDDGSLGVNELGVAMEMFGQYVTEDEVRAMIEEVDTDGNQTVELDEFIILLSHKMMSSAEDQIREAFRRFELLKVGFDALDKEGKGSLSKENIGAAMELFGQPLSQDELDRHFEEIDKDGSNSVSFSEFIQTMCGRLRPSEIQTIRPLQVKANAAHARVATLIDADQGEGVDKTPSEWTAEEQEALEQALRAFPASLGEERWDRITESVPGKTKDQCQHSYELGQAKAEAQTADAELTRARENSALQLKDAFRLFEKFESRIRSLRDIFNRFDADGSGELSLEELGEAMAMFGQQYDEREMKELMLEIDKDGNNTIDFHEFATLMVRKMHWSDSEERLKQVFEKCDTDGSGKISPEELRDFLQKVLGQTLTDEELGEMMNEVDEDGDGEISYEEFAKIKSHRGKLMEAVGQVEVMLGVVGALRSVMLERFWKLLFYKGQPLKVAFYQWRDEIETRNALRRMPEKWEKYMKAGGSSSRTYRGMSMEDKSFEERILSRADFTAARCSRCNFDHARLDNVSFYRSQLFEATFVSSNLRGADMSRATLSGANLKDAKLQGVNFEGALFEKMMIEGREVPPCDLSDAVFSKLKVPKPFKQKDPLPPLRERLRTDGVKVMTDLLGALAAGEEDEGGEDEEDDEEEEREQDEDEEDEDGEGASSKFAKLVNAGLDRTLGSLITVSKEFLVTFDEQLRDPLNAELQALERETSATIKQHVRESVERAATAQKEQTKAREAVERTLGVQIEKLILTDMIDDVITPLFERSLPRLFSTLQEKLSPKPPCRRAPAGTALSLKDRLKPGPVKILPASTGASKDSFNDIPLAPSMPASFTSIASSGLGLVKSTANTLAGQDITAHGMEGDEGGDFDEEGNGMDDDEEDIDEEGEESNESRGKRDTKTVRILHDQLLQAIQPCLDPGKLAQNKKVMQLRPLVLESTRRDISLFAAAVPVMAVPLLGDLGGQSNKARQRAKAELRKIVTGIDLLFAKVAHSLGVELVQLAKRILVSRVQSELARFQRPMQQLFLRYDRFEEQLANALIVAEAERNEKRLEDKMLMDTSDEQEAAPEQVEHVVTLEERYIRTGASLADELKNISKKEGEKPELTRSTVYTRFVGPTAYKPMSVWKALKMAQRELRRDELELNYLMDRLLRIEEISVTYETWRDYLKAWEALMKLRSQIQSERGQAIINLMVQDIKLCEGLGAATQLFKISGMVPNEIIVHLNDGPAQHIQLHAFRYRKMIDKELFGIKRVREVRATVAGMFSGFFVAMLIGFFNACFAQLASQIFGSQSPDSPPPDTEAVAGTATRML